MNTLKKTLCLNQNTVNTQFSLQILKFHYIFIENKRKHLCKWKKKNKLINKKKITFHLRNKTQSSENIIKPENQCQFCYLNFHWKSKCISDQQLSVSHVLDGYFTIELLYIHKTYIIKTNKKNQAQIINLDYNFKMDTIGISCFYFYSTFGIGKWI